ncbi:unnamed protein product [Rhizophagus irregularis]|uniref:Uncharacterized protein n=1 Tax=Rhizophagus irregularis TaxID=588596 RepID=A0A2I1FUG8_9GLOM|nr:hypothetical protein RhiirA4_391352 [Rhizophagus irregularis]CAB4422130.1 unnamed protein product [Rhizophagus irregularis]
MDVSKFSTLAWTIIFLITNMILSYLLFNIISLEPSFLSISILTICTPIIVFAIVNTFLASPTSKPSPIVITIPPPPPPSSSSAPSSSTKQKSS